MAGALEIAEPLLPTKLFIPLLEPDLLTRARLLDSLDEGRRTGLILVSAPAGSGKTTLIADWVRRSGMPTGWLSLDLSDDDPRAFLGCLAEAYDALVAGVGERVRAMLRAAPSPEPMAIARALVADVAAAELDGVIVLDDYHSLSDPMIHQVLSLLIERAQAAPTLVVITRSDPPLPLPRLRVRRQLTEIREADLRFQPTEASEFIRHFSGRDLSTESINALASRAEGWAAGLQLAALALRQAPDPDAFVAEFQGTHVYIADYLTDEVLAGLPESWQKFVVRTSLLERISGPLCDAALGQSGSQGLLEELSRANLFVVPLDSERRWFRYHHLFADLLRRRALEVDAGEREGILSRAAAWCMENGAIEDAVNYASRAGEVALAADLVARHGLQALAAGEAYRALRWIHLLPDEVVHASPDHSVIAAWAHSQQEPYGPIEELARHALDLMGGGERPYPHIDDVELHARLLLAGAETLDDGASGGFAADLALETIAEILAATPASNLPVRASAEVMSGKLLAFRGDYEGALAAHTRAREMAVRAGSDLLRLAGVTGIAETLLFQGRLHTVIQAVREAIGGRHSLRETLGSQVANLCAIQALAYLECGDEDAAEAALHKCRQALGADGSDDEWPPTELLGRVRQTAFHSSAAAALYGLEVQLRLLLRRGCLGEAEQILDRLGSAIPAGSHSAGSHSMVRALTESLRVRLHSAGDQRARPQRILPGEASELSNSLFWAELRRLTAVRAALAGSDPATAYVLSAEILEADAAHGPRLGLAEAWVLNALAAAALGRQDEAFRATVAALELTAPEQRAAVWIDAGASVVPLLEGVVTRRDGSREAISHAVELLALLRDRIEMDASRDRGGLSDRERAVLRLLAAGHTNQEIGRVLFLAVGTVKKHTHNIYSKLGVSNRTQAVQVARERDILLQADPATEK